MRGEDVRALRKTLLRELRSGQPDPLLSPRLTELVRGLTAAEVRTGLAWAATLCRVWRDVTPADVRLWTDTAGLRGVRVSVRDMAGLLGVSARQAHRRLHGVDDAVAAALNALTPQEFRGLAQWPGDGVRHDDVELAEAVRADSYLTVAPARALDAVTSYLRNRRGRASARRLGYVADNKDTRYRDAGRVAVWLEAVATGPPTPSTFPADEHTLVRGDGHALATEPREALAQVDTAIAAGRRQLLPLLLAHAGRLIPDPGAAGVAAWLSYLQLRYHVAMEAEHIVALRYARALQADAARLSPRGVADPQVRRGMSGRGHILQMFGHYDAALACFAQAVRHGMHFPATTDDQQQVAHDGHAQVVYTESLRGGRRAAAAAALRGVHAYADRHGHHVEIQFTRARRALEMRLAFGTRRAALVVAPAGRRHETLVADEFARFVDLATSHPSANRLLAAQDITLLYAVLTRDAGLAAVARDAFQEINDRTGGYANLTHRFNKRLAAAASLSERFRDIAPVTSPADPLRDPIAVPSRPTGLLVLPDPRA